MALATPSPTLYVSGLETRTKKPELRSQLYSLFNPYGEVIDIVAKKHDGGRGQAFIVFSEQTSATAALRGLSNEQFYGRTLSITYAKKLSNATIERTDPSASREAAAIKAAKMTVSRAQGEYEQLEKEREEAENGPANGKRELEDGEGGPASKKVKAEDDDEEEMEIEMEDDEDVSAGNGTTLICTNLPAECSEAIMGALFQQYPGFSKAAPYSSAPPSSHPAPNSGAKSFRIIFETQEQATAAAGATNKFLMQPGWEMAVSVQ